MRNRLVLLSSAITAMVVIAFSVPLALLVRDLAADRATTPAQLRAQSLAPVIALADTETAEAAVAAVAEGVAGTVHVLTPGGDVLGDGPLPDVPLRQAGVYQQADGGRAAVVPVIGAAGQGVVVVTVPAADVRRGVAAAWTLLALLSALLVAGAAWLTARLARQTIRALDDVEATARRLSTGDLTARSSVDDPEEVERIAQALNHLAQRTEELLASERERAADLSHELRTPLTALRLDAESLPPSLERDRVVDDIAAVEAAVDRAIHEARRPVREGAAARADLTVVVEDRCRWWEVLAADEERSFDWDVPLQPVWVRTTDDDVAAAVDALLGNVFSHTDPGVDLRLALVVEADRARLVVEDDGPGFPADLDVLDRGVSGAGSTGLGLAIVARTARAAGGEVAVTAGSSRVVVDLPVVPSPR